MFALLDWLIIGVYLAFSFAIGILVRDTAKTGMDGFFAAGRNMGWLMISTTLIATTFASDTPLVVSGWVATYGTAGNWFWWANGIAAVALAFFFARKWRESEVLTDVEIAELRYGGKPALILRTFKAFFSSIVVNCIILGWVFAAMSKISKPFIRWEEILGLSTFQELQALWPSFMILKDFNNTLTVFVMVFIVLLYSIEGGIKAVIVTDMFQFVLAIFCAYLIGFMAVHHVGGFEQMWESLKTLYPSRPDQATLSIYSDLAGKPFLSWEGIATFIPDFSVDHAIMPFSAFLLTLGITWWARGEVDGSGYISQRIYTAKNGAEAEKGAFGFAIGNYVLRHWPWVMAGLVALVVYPRVEYDRLAREMTTCLNQSETCTEAQKVCLSSSSLCQIKGFDLLQKTSGYLEYDGLLPIPMVERNSAQIQSIKKVEVYKEDREMAYPMLIKEIMPAGLIGLCFASLMAAFMSTVSTHINWGASYVANDFYYRLINPKATSQQLVVVSKLSVLAICVLATFIAGKVDNIGFMWELWAGMMAGLGLPHLLRWLWWRANAWTEISGLVTGFLLALGQILTQESGGLFHTAHPIQSISIMALISSVIAIIVTLLTPPVSDAQLNTFCQKVKPIGFWKNMSPADHKQRSFKDTLILCFVGCVSLYTLLFGFGWALRLEWIYASVLLVIGFSSLYYVISKINKDEAKNVSVD